MRAPRSRHLLASVAFAGVLFGLMAVGAAAPAARKATPAKAAGGLTVWVESLPQGLTPRVRVLGRGGPRTVTGTKTTLSLPPGVYTVVAGAVTGSRRSFYPRHDRVQVRVAEGATALALVDYATIVPRSTKVFTGAMARRLRSRARNQLIFRGTQPLGVLPPDVLVGGPTRLLPDGILVRVVSVRMQRGRTILRTSPARLTDAFPRGAIDLVARARGRVGAAKAGASQNDKTISLPGINIPVDRTLMKGGVSNDNCKADGDVTLKGGLVINPTIQVGMSWGLFPPRPRKVSFTGNVTEKADLVLGAQLTGECTFEFETPKVRVATFTLGPVPVTVDLSAHLKLDTSGAISASAGAHQSASLTAGLAYSDGKLKTIGSAETNFTVDPPQIGIFQAKATLRAGPVVTLKVAGVAGGHIGIDGVLGLDVMPLADPAWALSGGIEIGGGLDFLSYHKDVTLYDYSLPFAILTSRGGGSGGTPPGFGTPPFSVRDAGEVFPRPDLSSPPVDRLPEGTPLALTCVTKGELVSGLVGISDTWYGINDGQFINSVYVAASDITPDLPSCPSAGPAPETVPPPPAGQPAPQIGPRPRPTVHPVPPPPPPPPPVVTPPDTDGDGIVDANDRCPAAKGVAPHGCPRQRGIARTPDGGGYWLAAEDGGVFAFGSAAFAGSEGSTPLAAPVVGIAATPSGQGYWTVGADGGVFAHGDAPFKGALPPTVPNKPIVGIAGTPSGQGYWLAGEDGGVFAFGDAPFKGALPPIVPNKPIVAIVATPSGQGYWLIGADGGTFAYGDAPFLGSLAGQTLNAPIVGAARTASGQGLWLVGGDGGVFALGDAGFFGSLSGIPLNQPIVGIAPAPDGQGYWLLGGDGGVFALGSAVFHGGTATS